jgi:allantoicase
MRRSVQHGRLRGSDETSRRRRVLWRELLPRTAQPDARRLFEDELTEVVDVSYIRFNIFPDGGVARLRLFSRPMTLAELNRT